MKSIIDKLKATAGAMGSPIDADALELMAEDLKHLDEKTLHIALTRIRRESKSVNGFAPRLVLGDILELAGLVLGKDKEDVEAANAFDTTLKIATRYGRTGELRKLVTINKECPDCKGQGFTIGPNPDYPERSIASPCRCKKVEEIPEISDRIMDTVFRTGGWSAYVDVPENKFPFLKKEFLAEFKIWKKTQAVITDRKLPPGESMPSIKQLVASVPVSGIED